MQADGASKPKPPCSNTFILSSQCAKQTLLPPQAASHLHYFSEGETEAQTGDIVYSRLAGIMGQRKEYNPGVLTLPNTLCFTDLPV